ncbi:hypothetical protein F4825DRAFT_424261 [Nemania diffusa]|nr:hypothetical protein F4825DRAFT_424261 [Nemania diffusa]
MIGRQALATYLRRPLVSYQLLAVFPLWWFVIALSLRSPIDRNSVDHSLRCLWWGEAGFFFLKPVPKLVCPMETLIPWCTASRYGMHTTIQRIQSSIHNITYLTYT